MDLMGWDGMGWDGKWMWMRYLLDGLPGCACVSVTTTVFVNCGFLLSGLVFHEQARVRVPILSFYFEMSGLVVRGWVACATQ